MIDPPKGLFNCPTYHEDDSKSTPSILCIEGIQCGYQKSGAVPFDDLHSKCEPISSNINRLQTFRPKVTLIRKTNVMKLLRKVINCQRIDFNEEVSRHLIYVILFLDDDPDLFRSTTESICGVSARDFRMDYGEHSAFSNLKTLFFSLFNIPQILGHLLIQLHVHFKETKQPVSYEPTTAEKKRSKKSSSWRAVLCNYMKRKYLRSTPGIEFGSVPWRDHLLYLTTNEKALVMNLVTIVLKSPLPSFIPRNMLSSLTATVTVCQTHSGENLYDIFVQSFESKDAKFILLNFSRIVSGGLLIFAKCDRLVESLPQTPLPSNSIADCLNDVYICIVEYYSTYDRLSRKQASSDSISCYSVSALDYFQNWSACDETVLLEQRTKFSEKCSDGKGERNVFQTGSYFPGLAHLRSFPFTSISEVDGDSADCE